MARHRSVLGGGNQCGDRKRALNRANPQGEVRANRQCRGRHRHAREGQALTGQYSARVDPDIKAWMPLIYLRSFAFLAPILLQCNSQSIDKGESQTLVTNVSAFHTK